VSVTAEAKQRRITIIVPAFHIGLSNDHRYHCSENGLARVLKSFIIKLESEIPGVKSRIIIELSIEWYARE
jgi:hypothetical protein